MLRLCTAFAIAFLLAACSSPGSQYLGQWENTKNSSDTFTIVRNGDGFLLVVPKRNIFTGKEEGEEKVPAVLKDGLMHVQSAMGGTTMAHVKASDTLTGQGILGAMEYKRTR